jgi:hypothetical protein
MWRLLCEGYHHVQPSSWNDVALLMWGLEKPDLATEIIVEQTDHI